MPEPLCLLPIQEFTATSSGWMLFTLWTPITAQTIRFTISSGKYSLFSPVLCWKMQLFGCPSESVLPCSVIHSPYKALHYLLVSYWLVYHKLAADGPKPKTNDIPTTSSGATLSHHSPTLYHHLPNLALDMLTPTSSVATTHAPFSKAAIVSVVCIAILILVMVILAVLLTASILYWKKWSKNRHKVESSTPSKTILSH